MLKPKSPQESFYGSYLYDRIVPIDHLLRKINQVVDFSFAGQILFLMAAWLGKVCPIAKERSRPRDFGKSR
jgi:hypothetical protein